MCMSYFLYPFICRRGKWGVAVYQVYGFHYIRWLRPKDLLYNIIALVNNTASYTGKFVKGVKFMVNVTTIKKRKRKWNFFQGFVVVL